MSTLKHNKKRNSGLVYEFLVRRMTSQVLDGDVDGYKKSVGIVQRYYSPGEPLAKERELFEVLCSTRGVTQYVAYRILNEVKKRSNRLDRKLIDIKKSNLIKEINYTFGRDFFSAHRLPEYRLLASIHMFLESDGNGLSENIAHYQIEDGLIRFMTSSESAAQPQRQEKDVDNLVCTLAAKKFQERYRGSLNREQKNLLEKYMVSTLSGGDQEKLLEFIQKERSRLASILAGARNLAEVKEDSVMSERLTEATNYLLGALSTLPIEEKVEDLMLYYKLVQEISSND